MTPQITPRQRGILAAQSLAISLAHNPYDEAPHEGLAHEQPGHPHHDWETGFVDTRILLHMQTRRMVALGIGIVEAWRYTPDRTREMLIKIGTRSGESLCLIILAAMFEAEDTIYDLDDPITVQVILAALKLRMTGLPAVCHEEGHLELMNRAHNLAGALLVMFDPPQDGKTCLRVGQMTKLMDRLVELDNETKHAIAAGTHR